MDITSMNATNRASTETSKAQNFDSQLLGEKGEVIEGKISKVSDRISINFNGKEVAVSKSAVRDAKEGEIRKFEIMDVSNTSIVLKEVGNREGSNHVAGIICTTIETDQISFAEQLEKSLGEEDEEDEAAKEKLESFANRMTAEDYKALIDEGFSFESYELQRLERALKRIKEQRSFKEENIEIRINKREEYSSQVEKISISNRIQGPMVDQIVQKLVESNLPITTENITSIANAMELAGTINSMSDQAVAYMINNEVVPTIDHIYHAQYSGGPLHSRASEQDWNELLNQVEGIILKAGMEVNESTINQGKWLFLNNLPITEKSLSDLSTLKQIKETYTSENILDCIISSVAKGIEPKETVLGNDTLALAKQAMEEFNTISDEAIIQVSESQQDPNLEQLKAAQALVNQSAVSLHNGEINIADITAKRQLEEIRLKMTVEAGRTLIDKGIDLNTSGLQKIVEGLKELENQYYKNLLQEANASDRPENIDLLRETTVKINELKEAPSYVLGSVLGQKTIQTVETLHSAATGIKVQLEKAGQSYEALMTAPRKDMGDSIEKAFKNVSAILEEMNLENTEANQRAVRILGYNTMEITEQSILEVKSFDSQVNNLMKNLHPAVTVEMIKQGINPLETPVEELNDQISNMKESLGITEEEKYSKYLWKLEKEEGISEEERKSFIGVYRLLNNVEKTKGAAVGAVIQAGQEVTLQNLLTAVRTIKSGGIDQSVDDSFGALESLSFQKETITDQVSAAFKSSSITTEEQEKTDYISSILQNVMEEITPQKLGVVADSQMETVLNMSIEKLQDSIAGVNTNEQTEMMFQEESVSQIRALVNESQTEIEFLLDYQMPISIHNIRAAQSIMEDKNNLFRAIQKKVESFSKSDKKEFSEAIAGLEETVEDASTLQAEYDRVEQSIQNILKKEYENQTITSKEIADLKMLGSGIELAKELSKKECYEIPIEVAGNITNIKLTIVSDKATAGQVHISMNSNSLGQVETDISIKGNTFKGLILCEDREGLQALSTEKESLTTKIKDLDLEVKQLDYGLSRGMGKNYIVSPTSTEEDVTKIDTSKLYQVAKAFIQTIKIAEMKNQQ